MGAIRMACGLLGGDLRAVERRTREGRLRRAAAIVGDCGALTGHATPSFDEPVFGCLPESGLAKAINYMAARWSRLTRFLNDPCLPLDNNAAERALRGPVIGRKNHYGSRSRRGTEVAAILYSLLESAKIVGLNPTEYMHRAVDAALRGEVIPLPHEITSASPAPS